MLRNTGFKPKTAREPRPDRSAEFASVVLERRPAVMVRADAPRAVVPVPPPSRKQGRKPATKAESEYMGRVAALGCIVCRLLGQQQTSRTEVHHARAGAGGAQRGGNYLVIPACGECHRGPDGIHGSRARLALLRMGELDLLNLTIAALAGKE